MLPLQGAWVSILGQGTMILQAVKLGQKKRGKFTLMKYFKNRPFQDFSSGTIVKNPCANAKDMGSIPGTGGFHMLWGN